MINPFFKNSGPFKIHDILKLSDIENIYKYKDTSIFSIKDLVTASSKDITFFHSKKYETAAANTKAAYCITTKKLSHILPNNCQPIEVENVLISTAKITKIFYQNAISDDFDSNVTAIESTSFQNLDGEIITVVMNKTNQKIGYKLIVGESETFIEIQPRAMQTIIY